MANWSAERKDSLRTMWKEGFTSAQISEILGGVSRNAVMGMVHRLGLMGDPDHAANSASRLSGCCATGWRRVAPEPLEAGMTVTGPMPDPIVVPDAPSAIVIANDDDVSILPVVAANDEQPVTASEPEAPAQSAPVEIAVVEVEPEAVVEPAPVERPAPVEQPAPAVIEETPPWDADPALVEAAVAAEVEQAPVTEAAPAPAAQEDADPVIVSEPDPLPIAASLADVDAQEDEGDDVAPAPEPVATIPRPRPVPKPVAKVAERRIPSSRSWRPLESFSRMPPKASEVPPPGEVVISDGVMSDLRSVRIGMAEPTDAFDLLKRLTGVAYDARVPGHVPALVAIATVLARGDPRSVLTPTVPEQSVLRVMRTFAEKGVVVAGKPPARWLEDVNDRAFYDEMLKLEAA